MAGGLDTSREVDLDARKLFSMKIGVKGEESDTLEGKEYPIEGNAMKILDVVDSYIQFLSRDIRTSQAVLMPTSQKQYEEIRQNLLRQILSIKGFDIWKVATASVDKNGFLWITYKDGRKESWNIVSNWNAILYPKAPVTPILQATLDKEKKLRDEMNRESYLGGSVIIEYAPAATLLGVKSIALGQGAWMIKSIYCKTETNQLHQIKLDQFYTGSKEILGQNLMKILQATGYLFDAGKRIFFDPVGRAVLEGVEGIKGISYDQWKKIPGNEKVSEHDFRKYKDELLSRGKPALDMIRTGAIPAGRALGTLADLVSKNAMHLFFLPVFFQKFSKYQNNLTFLLGVSEGVLFMGGAKIGKKVAELINTFPLLPKISKPIIGTALPLLVGGVSIVKGEELAKEYFDAVRQKWRTFNGSGFGSQYTDGYSALGHATGLGITDALHQVNRFTRWISDGKEDDWDLGIPRTEVPLWKGKYLMTIPEITWFQDKINFGTNPWEWVRGAVGRDIDTWNQYVDLYKPRLKRAIYDLLGKYARDESMFSDKDELAGMGGKDKQENKDKLLEKHLTALLESGGSGEGFREMKKKLIETVIAKAPEVKNSKGPIKYLDEVIDMNVEMLKVDVFFLKDRMNGLEGRKLNIFKKIDEFPVPLDQKTKDYMKSIFARMVANLPLFAPDVNMDRDIGTRQKLRKRIPSEENLLFHQILDIDTEVEIDGKKLKAGAYFSVLLDSMLDWKREYEFLEEIKKGNKKGVQWNL